MLSFVETAAGAQTCARIRKERLKPARSATWRPGGLNGLAMLPAPASLSTMNRNRSMRVKSGL